MDLVAIAKLIGAEYEGESFEVTGMNTLKDASNSEISFVSSSKYLKDIENSQAGAVIVDAKTKELVPKGSIALVVENPYWEVARLSKEFAPLIEDKNLPEPLLGKETQISDKAEIARGAVIGNNCIIMANVYVGANAVIGNNTILYPNVVIYRDCVIGSDCIIHAKVKIGSDGFGFATNKMGEHKKIYQNGNVVVEDDVEIGSGTTIDRAVFGSTYIKKGCRFDNLTHIGHNCEIGEYSVFAAQCGIAGSTKLGRNVVMGGQSGMAGHLEIAPFSTFGAKTGVTNSIKESGKTYSGFPHKEHRMWLKLQAKLARLIK